MKNINNFINGQFCDTVSGQWMDNVNPSTGEVSSQLAASNAEDIEQAVAAAQAAFPSWSKTPAQKRADALHRIADLIENRLDALAQAESQDQGKPLWLARSVDIPRAVSNFRFFAGAILHHQEESSDMDGRALNYSLRQPMGVAGLISPWNLPLYLLTWKIAPAIAVGNTAVCKPSELTPLTAFLLADILQEAEVPPGVVNIVFGRGPEAGQALVEHPKVPLISFTGGTQTAQHIISASAPHFKKLGLELGGKNPNLIFNDADIDACVETTIKSSFLNQGEICLCGSRIFVQAGIYDQFLEQFVNQSKKLKVGDPADPSSNLGALVSQQHLNKVQGYIELAQKEGGSIVCGGDQPSLDAPFDQGYFLNPTIITGLSPDSRCMQEEIFGPVVSVVPFKDEAQVLEWANGTPYGLSATVWTENLGRAHRMARDLQAGTVWVNTWILRDLRVPFGGVKASGLGREGGEHSLDFYTEQKKRLFEIRGVLGWPRDKLWRVC